MVHKISFPKEPVTLNLTFPFIVGPFHIAFNPLLSSKPWIDKSYPCFTFLAPSSKISSLNLKEL